MLVSDKQQRHDHDVAITSLSLVVAQLSSRSSRYTPKEHSSGSSRHLGRISKRGDRYLRMLLTHGARSVLQAATVAHRCHRPLDGLRTWALAVQDRTHRNKAVCALANKLARICYATLRDAEPYHGTQTAKKLGRSSYAIADTLAVH